MACATVQFSRTRSILRSNSRAGIPEGYALFGARLRGDERETPCRHDPTMADFLDPTTLLTSAVVAAIVTGAFNVARERYILDRKAAVDYESNARRRLYEAIEPLRLELVFAARDLASRVGGHVRAGGRAATRWNLSGKEYYVQSFVFRILRPLAVGQLIQRQMSFADFAVDEHGKEVLRFDSTAREMLTGSNVLSGLKGDWSFQTDHLFSDNLHVAAATLHVRDPDGPTRVMDFSEFVERVRAGKLPSPVSELFAIFEKCKENLLENPVFWLRLVAYGFVCQQFVEPRSEGLGFRKRPFEIEAMLREAASPEISSDPGRYAAAIRALTTS